jgi:sugar/nucleoside kinase (ribokinase family)
MDLGARLADAPSPTVTCLPDGSVDRRYGVLDADHAPLARDEFVESLTRGQRSFATERRGVEPGGQAVNAALQARALDADVTLLGHLDHEVFETLDVDSASMGSPATVDIYEFDDAAMMLTTESTDLETWSYEDVVDSGREGALDAAAVVWTNWASVPNATAALRRAADRSGEGGVFVLDPGGLSMRPAAECRELVAVLGALADRYEVAVSANDEELTALADAVGVEGTIAEAAMGVREAAGIAAVVMHGDTRAVAATDGAVVDQPNVEAASVSRFTGGGDRFTAALAFARACGWDWRPALQLGNGAASYYVGTGGTGDRTDIANCVREGTGSLARDGSHND